MCSVLEIVRSNSYDPKKIFTDDSETFTQVKTAFENINGVPKDKCILFLTEKITPTIFDKTLNNKIRDQAIELGFVLLNNVDISYLPPSALNDLFTRIEEKYVSVIGELRDNNYDNWDKLWIFLIKLCNEKIHQKVPLTNKILRTIEVAFRNSTSIDHRVKAYDCWREWINLCSLNMTNMCSTKQLRLLVTPMKAKFSRMPLIVQKRCETFVYLLEKLGDKATLCIKEFLEFCFSPVDDNKATENKNVPNVFEIGTKVLIAAIGHDHLDETCISTADINFKGPLITANNFANFYEILITSVCECCVLLKRWEQESEFVQITIMKCLWRRLFALIKDSHKQIQTKCFTLINSTLKDVEQRLNHDIFYANVLANVVEVVTQHQIDESLKDNLFNISLQLLKHHYDEKTGKKLIEFVLHCVESEKYIKILASYFQLDTTYQNIKPFCLIWLKTYRNEAVICPAYQLWAIKNYKSFDSKEAVLAKWKKLYINECETDTVRIALIQEMTKLFQENPLLSSNVVQFTEVVSETNSDDKKFVEKLITLIKSLSSFANLPEQDTKILSSIILTYFQQKSVVLQAENNDQLITDLCQCLENIVNIHKDYEILPKLSKILSECSTQSLLKLSKQVMPVLENLMLNDDTNVLNDSRKLIELLDKNDEKIGTNVSNSRANRIVNMANKLSPSARALKLFGKNVETSTPIRGSMLNLSPKKSSPLGNSLKRRHNEKDGPAKRGRFSLEDEKSSDFVKISTEVKLEVSKLSEHQKEVLKKRREDIPALYEDLSQSQTQELSNLSGGGDSLMKNGLDKAETSESTSKTNDNNTRKSNRHILRQAKITEEFFTPVKKTKTNEKVQSLTENGCGDVVESVGGKNGKVEKLQKKSDDKDGNGNNGLEGDKEKESKKSTGLKGNQKNRRESLKKKKEGEETEASYKSKENEVLDENEKDKSFKKSETNAKESDEKVENQNNLTIDCDESEIGEIGNFFKRETRGKSLLNKYQTKEKQDGRNKKSNEDSVIIVESPQEKEAKTKKTKSSLDISSNKSFDSEDKKNESFIKNKKIGSDVDNTRKTRSGLDISYNKSKKIRNKSEKHSDLNESSQSSKEKEQTNTKKTRSSLDKSSNESNKDFEDKENESTKNKESKTEGDSDLIESTSSLQEKEAQTRKTRSSLDISSNESNKTKDAENKEKESAKNKKSETEKDSDLIESTQSLPEKEVKTKKTRSNLDISSNDSSKSNGFEDKEKESTKNKKSKIEEDSVIIVEATQSLKDKEETTRKTRSSLDLSSSQIDDKEKASTKNKKAKSEENSDLIESSQLTKEKESKTKKTRSSLDISNKSIDSEDKEKDSTKNKKTTTEEDSILIVSIQSPKEKESKIKFNDKINRDDQEQTVTRHRSATKLQQQQDSSLVDSSVKSNESENKRGNVNRRKSLSKTSAETVNNLNGFQSITTRKRALLKGNIDVSLTETSSKISESDKETPQLKDSELETKSPSKILILNDTSPEELKETLMTDLETVLNESETKQQEEIGDISCISVNTTINTSQTQKNVQKPKRKINRDYVKKRNVRKGLKKSGNFVHITADTSPKSLECNRTETESTVITINDSTVIENNEILDKNKIVADSEDIIEDSQEPTMAKLVIKPRKSEEMKNLRRKSKQVADELNDKNEDDEDVVIPQIKTLSIQLTDIVTCSSSDVEKPSPRRSPRNSPMKNPEGLPDTETMLMDTNDVLETITLEKSPLKLSASEISDTLTARSDCLTPIPKIVKDDLATSPITCNTPDRTLELLNSTSDISPINLQDGSTAGTPLLTKAKRNDTKNLRVARLLQLVNPSPPVKGEGRSNWLNLQGSPGKATRRMKAKKNEELEVLTFSREIPSPLVVPASGILKRKSFGEDAVLPSPKRKRVNFSDPAITEKKVFIKDANEYSLNGCESIMPETTEKVIQLDDLDKLLESNLEREEMIPIIKSLCELKFKNLNMDNTKFQNIFKQCSNNIDTPEIVDSISEYLEKNDDSEECKQVFLSNLYTNLEQLPTSKIEEFIKRLVIIFNEEKNEATYENYKCIFDDIQNYVDNINDTTEKNEFLIKLIEFGSSRLPANKENLQVHLSFVQKFVERIE